jgi:hypothetical protein
LAAPEQSCEICRELEDAVVIDNIAAETFPPVVDRLEKCGGVRRCPLCHGYYLMTHESDPHHYMSSETWLRRIDETEALGVLARMPAKQAKPWLNALDADARTAELVKAIEADASAEAAATVAAVYVQRQCWDELEALLRHKSSDVRNAAIGELERPLADNPASIIDAVTGLLADQDCARAAHDAFSQATGTPVSPVVTTLVDCFDHEDSKVRAMAVDSVIHHLDLGSGYYIDETGSGNYRTPLPFTFGEATTEMCARLPRLVEHILEPRPARWLDMASYPRSTKARDHPNELNTAVGASEVIRTLINQDEPTKALVRETLAGQRPQLRKMLSEGKTTMTLGAGLYLFVREVAHADDG